MSDEDDIGSEETRGKESRVDDRLDAFYRTYSLNSNAFSQVFEDSVRHSLAARPGLPALQPHEVWVPVGPRNVAGRIAALAQDPTDRNVFYAGSAFGGLWRSIDAGDTWQHLGADEHNFPVSAIAIPEADPTTLFIGTGAAIGRHPSGRGLYRVRVPSPRADAVFDRLVEAHPPSMPPSEVNRFASLRGSALRYTRIRMDPFDKDRFWAASQSGLWRWEGRAPSHFILEFPDAVASGDLTTFPDSAIPAGGRPFHSYATDVAVAADPRDRTTMPGSSIPRFLVLYVAIWKDGIYRGRFDRQSGTTTWERRLPFVGLPPSIGRIQIALCDRVPQRLYALFAVISAGPDSQERLSTTVFRSDNNGEAWTAKTNPFSPNENQAGYDLVLEVSPVDPDLVYAGIVNAFLTRDGGNSWNQILFSDDYDRGDHASHADQHAALFDRFDPRRLWIGNDGGLAVARDLRRPPRSEGFWRIRSHGIVGAQFQALGANPVANLGFMTGGGMQDNGSSLGFGGPSWFPVGWGDGAYFAFDPGNVRQYIVSNQAEHDIASIVAPVPQPTIVDHTINDLPDTLAPQNAIGVSLVPADGLVGTVTNAPFIPVIAQNPANAQQLILGWRANGPKGGAPGVAAYSSIDAGAHAIPLNGPLPAAANASSDCTAATFGPTVAGAAEGWVGFRDGTLLHTANAPAGAWAAPAAAPPWVAAVGPEPIGDIAVHPVNPAIVAICTSRTPGRVFITYDGGAHWQDLTARVPTAIVITPAAPSMPVNNILQFTATANFADGGPFDATSSVTWTSSDTAKADFSPHPGEEGRFIAIGTGNIQVTANLSVFGVAVPAASTAVTVTAAGAAPPPVGRVARGFDVRALSPSPMTCLAFDIAGGVTRLFVGTAAGVYVLPIPAAGPVPINWRPFSQRLPLMLVTDMITMPSTRMLRIATFGRGIWDCDLAGTTRRQHRLNIRQTLIEDGFSDARPFPPPITHDPRLPAGTAALDHTHAFDIRIDAPPLQFFDDRVDGVELDERLGVDTLVPLATNAIYVQVHNVGRDPITNVAVHLYFRQSPAVPDPGAAAVPIPALGPAADFYHSPGFDPAAGAAWQRVGPAQILPSVAPAAPATARFDWRPPATLANPVALLALTSGDGVHDRLPPALVGNPLVAAFVPNERRAALRVAGVGALPFPDIFIRGGVEDDGRSGASVTALRSPDIIIGPGAGGAFPDLLDLRPQDRLHGGTANHIYVRVHNRGAAVHVEVELWAMKVKADLTPDVPNWIVVPPATPPKIELDVPANGSAVGEAVWTPPDPAPTEAQKSYILVALVKSADNRDPLPNKATVVDEATLFQFLSRAGGSDNVAARAVRWVTP